MINLKYHIIMKLSIFTSFTNPDDRNDPWKEALACYEDVADEVITVGQDWPEEFSWEHIGKTFQKGFDLCTGDWVIRMDIDYFFHEKDIFKIKNSLEKFKNFPAVGFPQYQFYSPKRYQIKTILVIAFNKKNFPEIKLNGGGDLCQATLDGELISAFDVPIINIPIWQYDNTFRTKEIIYFDRGRFARAWFRWFKSWNDRGGSSNNEAYDAWYLNIVNKFPNHTLKKRLKNHPKYILDKLQSLQIDQFGYNCFGLNERFEFKVKNLFNQLKILLIIKLKIIKYKLWNF